MSNNKKHYRFITIKMALRSVFRRPKQNIAVLIGITLGVSLFSGVQIGSDSLTRAFNEADLHQLGEIEAEISSPYSEFFLSNEIINEIFTGEDNLNIKDELLKNNHLYPFVDSLSQRLELSVTVIDEAKGSTEISKPLVGIDETETGFGDLLDSSGNVLHINSLGNGEIYIGDGTADLLFGKENPIGKNVTISTSIHSFANPLANISQAKIIPLELNVKIVGLFVDRERGRENYADYMVANIEWLQIVVSDTINLETKNNPNILGFGSKPITRIIVNWEDKIQNEGRAEEAIKVLEEAFEEVIGLFYPFYKVIDNWKIINDASEAGTTQIRMVLNIFGSIIIMAGLLVIVNIQMMALSAREKETGIIRAIGSSKRQIIMLNLIESMILGLVGSLFGIIGGILYGKLLVIFMSVAFDFSSSEVSTVITESTLIYSFIAGVLISQLTGLLPSISASKVNVAQVLRGFKPPESEKFGKKSLYFGLLFSVFTIYSLTSLNPNPFIDGKKAFSELSNAETIYFQIGLLILGPALLFSYFYSKRIGLTTFSIYILVWAYFNIFFAIDWINSGVGGFVLIFSLILSLIIGSILLFGLNLSFIANFGQKIIKTISSKNGSALLGTTLVAFRKMTSKKTRSTLTFALFATILTLNIFIATFSYSFRYGFESAIDEVAGGSDILLSSDQPIPDSIDFTSLVEERFNKIKMLKEFTITDSVDGYLSDLTNDKPISTQLVSMHKNALWDENGNWILKLNLADDKNGTPYETMVDPDDGPIQTKEDEIVWKALLDNDTITRDESSLPIILTTFIYSGEGFDVKIAKETGDTVFLNLTDGSSQEFVIGGIVLSNPIVDFTISEFSGMSYPSVWFVNDYWASKIAAFQGLSGNSNLFLGKTNVDDINSNKINAICKEIEEWANQASSDFRETYGLFGIVGVSVYSIYEVFMDGQYRFMNFIQAFVSLGFIVGILGLFVVASRSVAERTREIGMLRAIGFRKSDILNSVVLELVVMSLIGLFIGLINGIVLGYAITKLGSGGLGKFLIPWPVIAFYAALTVISAITAAIFPAIKASKIPPSDALRYTG